MLIQPVYLLPPEPDRRVKLSRRIFFGGAAGLALGMFGAGYVARGWWNRSDRRSDASIELTDGTSERREPEEPQLRWARERAVGDVELLVRDAIGFLAVQSAWDDDPILLEGLRRLCAAVVDPSGRANRVPVARYLLRHANQSPMFAELIEPWRPALQRVAGP